MAAQMVADKGIPVFPSGTLYLQGATVSYVLAPLFWFHLGGLDHLTLMRMLSVITGTLAVWALYFLAKFMLRNAWIATGAAAMLAFNPGQCALERSGPHVCDVAVDHDRDAAAFSASPPASRNAALVDRVRDHILDRCVYAHRDLHFVPPMAILALWKHRIALIGRRIDLTIAIGVAALAPVTLLVLNRVVTPPQATPAGSQSGVGFVGDYLLSVRPTP